MAQCQYNYSQIIHEAYQQLKSDLSKLKNFRGKLSSGGEILFQQKMFLRGLIKNFKNKISLDVLKIYDILEQRQQFDLKNIIQKIMELALEDCNGEKAYTADAFFYRQTRNRNQNCRNCKQTIQKISINRIKQKMGLCQIKNQASPAELSIKDMKRQAEDDEFMLKHKFYMSNLEFHIGQLLKTLQKNIISKASQFLSQYQQFQTGKLQLQQQLQIVKMNEKQFNQIQKYKQKFTSNFIQQIKIPIQSTVLTIFRNMQQKQRQKYKQTHQDMETQTTLMAENQIILQLQQKIKQLKFQISKIKSAKNQSERNLLRLLERQGEIKKQLTNIKQQKIILQQKYRFQQDKFNKFESKSRYQINRKEMEISKLEKNITELKQRKNQYEAKMSTLSTRSIKDKKGTSKALIQKQSKRKIQPRPSLDFKIMQQLQNGYSRFHSNKKSKNSRGRKVQIEDSHLANKVIADQKQLAQSESSISSKTSKLRQKTTNLHIHKEISITINNRKQNDQNVDPRASTSIQNKTKLNNFNKKIKTLRILKPYRKQMNAAKNSVQLGQQKSQINLSANTVVKQNYLPIQQMKKSYDGSIRTKTEANQIKQNAETNKIINGFSFNSKSIQKMKSSAILVRQIKSRCQQPKTPKTFKDICLSQITAENIVLFGNEKTAVEYEKNIGIWPHLVIADKLAVDFENASYSIQIQKYFNHLEEENYQKFRQYMKFLLDPSTYIRQKNKNQQIELRQFQFNKIKEIFTKLIRFHKVVHKNCSHVSDFLQHIGFNQY